jgi:hypothetical protein
LPTARSPSCSIIGASSRQAIGTLVSCTVFTTVEWGSYGHTNPASVSYLDVMENKRETHGVEFHQRRLAGSQDDVVEVGVVELDNIASRGNGGNGERDDGSGELHVVG